MKGIIIKLLLSISLVLAAVIMAVANQMMRDSYAGVYESIEYGVRVELGELNDIEVEGQQGIAILARAWRGNQPVGFGEDGSVEWERFRIFNPPVLVDDLNGPITRELTNEVTGERKIRRLREDPVEAIRQVVAHNITIVGKDGKNIQSGKIGSTTSTFFSDAHPESSTVDGDVSRASVDETLANIRSDAGTAATSSNANVAVPRIRASTTTDQFQRLHGTVAK